jgi:hypothetical protein
MSAQDSVRVAPCVVITVELEASPRVEVVAQRDGDVDRLRDWLHHSDWTRELVPLLRRLAA